jgi:hypothetical protein
MLHRRPPQAVGTPGRSPQKRICKHIQPHTAWYSECLKRLFFVTSFYYFLIQFAPKDFLMWRSGTGEKCASILQPVIEFISRMSLSATFGRRMWMRFANTLQNDMNATKLDSLSRTSIDTTMVTRAYISNTGGWILYVLSRTTHMTFNEKLRVWGKTCKNAICNISAGAVATDVNIGMFAFGDTNPIQSCRPYRRWGAGVLGC